MEVRQLDKAILALILLVCTTQSVRAQWRLVFSDEFNGNSLDLNKWEYQSGCGETFGLGNKQCYVSGGNNVAVRNGNLEITTRVENQGGKSFTSGRIRQRGNGFRFGKYNIRARLPHGKLLWPAIWLKSKGSDCYAELDIMEARGEDPSRIMFTAHYGRDVSNLVKHGLTAETNAGTGFHEFELIWTPEQLQWFVDGSLQFSQSLDPKNWAESGKKTCSGRPFSQTQNLILNTAVGGRMFEVNSLSRNEAMNDWTKNTFEIDYVRIYEVA